MDILAVATGAGHTIVQLAAEAEAEHALFQINLFWVIVSALNFILFFIIIWTFAFKPVSAMLSERKARIEQGLKDAEQARRDRENAEAERVATLAEARREANDILTRAQKVAQESRDADIAATKDELERMRVRATAEIEAEKVRAIADVRAEVADLALLAASRVVGESMTDDRQRRLVDEFLSSSAIGDCEELMANRDSAARRYAEAAFQVAERDSTIDVWRRELEEAATIVEEPAIGRTLSNPAIALDTRAAAVDATFGRVASEPVVNLIQLMLRRGRIEDVPRVASEFRRLDNARQGITIATATVRRSARARTRWRPSPHDSKHSPVVTSNSTCTWTRACSADSSSRSATA